MFLSTSQKKKNTLWKTKKPKISNLTGALKTVFLPTVSPLKFIIIFFIYSLIYYYFYVSVTQLLAWFLVTTNSPQYIALDCIILHKGMHCPLLANNHIYEIEICGMLTSSGTKTDDKLHQRQTNWRCMTEPEVIKSQVFNSTILTLYLPHRNSVKMFEIVVECVCIAAAR